MSRATQIIKAKLVAHDPEDILGSGHVLLGNSIVRWCDIASQMTISFAAIAVAAIRLGL
jgi:hypothetical protein